MSAILVHESELQFELGGPAYRLMQRVGLIKAGSRSILRRTFAFLSITWVPLAIFALFEGRAIGPTPGQSFLYDFATYARFFLSIPLIFLAEAVVGPRIHAAGLHFVQGGFVRPADIPAVEAAVVRSHEWREAWWPEAVMLAVAVLGAWFTVESWNNASDAARWSSLTRHDGNGVSLTGLWYHLIAVPLLQFFALRWLWRLGIWVAFLFKMSRLDLNTVATHPDSAGGLAFLGGAHVVMSIFACSIGCILSGYIGFQLVFQGAAIESYKGLLIFYLVLMEMLCLGPLLLFVPLLARARRAGLRQYSVLVDTYNRSFDRKWVTGGALPDEPLLGSADIQSLADLGNSYRMIQDMKVIPFGRQHVLQVAVVSCLPLLPLAFLVMPVAELLKLLAGVIL